MGSMWWAAAASVAAGHPRPLVREPVALKSTVMPTQMAIPLQMENFLNSWSLQQERV
ncbi:hypothetical protein [Acidovorax sp. BLS4]|uniref:hypothetical protein n=1 Tax=Acidovorax sp. BLS4 TaxID=3273430 RepID=UPI0029425D05|nr:hypothetical protein [Paracidovorax avenae]WOI45323.1 hypothetical protein R1Z03_22865 [Paracidovorax avenae]